MSKNYIFVERKINEDYTQVAIKITEGKYSGLIFSANDVSIDPSDPEAPVLNFKTKVEFTPEDVKEIGEDFNQIAGDIILDILDEDYKEKSQ